MIQSIKQIIRCHIAFLFLLLIAFQSNAQDEEWLVPYEDYSTCKTGFVNANNREGDTVYHAMFENLTDLYVFYEKSRNRTIKHWILSENGKFGCISEKNKWFLGCVYDTLSYDYFSNQFIVKKNGKVGTLDLETNVVFPFEFDDIYTECPTIVNNYYPDWCGNLINSIFARKNGLLGVYDKTTQQILAPEFDSIQVYFYNASYDDKIGDTIFKQFYKVKKNGRFGLYDRFCKLIVPVQYSDVKPLCKFQLVKNTQLFSITDSLGQNCIVDEQGKQLTPFSKFRYEIAVTADTKEVLETPKFAIETDAKARKTRITNLRTGKSSMWYSQLRLIGNWVWVTSSHDWLLLDSNFNVVFSQVNPSDELNYFDVENQLKPVKSAINSGNSEELWSYQGMQYSIPPVFVINQKSTKKREQREGYGLINAFTGKPTVTGYHKIIRMQVDTSYYYWCFSSISDTSAEQSEVVVDIYDGSVNLLKTIHTNWLTEALDPFYWNSYQFSSAYTFPIVWTVESGKYVMHGVDGWQPEYHEFERQPIGLYKWNDSIGNIHFIDSSGHHYFTDFEGKPLMEGKHFQSKRNVYGSKWLLDLDDGTYTQFVNEKLEVLIDSCTDVMYVRAPKIRYNWRNYDHSTFVSRKGLVYLIDNDSVSLVDAKMFDHPNGMNEVSTGLYVDDSGKKIPAEQISRYLKSGKKSFGDLILWLENGNLHIENKYQTIKKVIPNVLDYKPDYGSSISVINNENKEGLLNYRTGDWILKPIYEHAMVTQRNGPMTIFARDKRFHDTCWFVVNTKGEPLTKPIFDEPFVLENNDFGWTYALSNKKYGIINYRLEWVTQPEYITGNTFGGIMALKGADHYAIVEEKTGRSFRTIHDTVVRINGGNYLFLFNDSIQIVDMMGKELLPPTKTAEAISNKNLGSFFYERYDWNEIPYAVGDHLITADSDTFLIRLSNELILQNAGYEPISLKIMTDRYSYTINDGNCHRRATFVNSKIYSEELKGSCFEHPESLQESDWSVSYKNYWIRNDALVPIESLCDLFMEGADFEPTLDKLIGDQIQQRQTFGIACANIPAAVAEFKLHFYFRDGYLVFVYYDLRDTYYVEINPNDLSGLLKDFLE